MYDQPEPIKKTTAMIRLSSSSRKAQRHENICSSDTKNSMPFQFEEVRHDAAKLNFLRGFFGEHNESLLGNYHWMIIVSNLEEVETKPIWL